MKRTTLLSTAAVVLMLGAGAALAQSPVPSKDQPPAKAAPAAQQKAPAEKIAPPAATKPATSAQAPKAADGKADMKVPPAAAGKAEIKGTADTSKSADSKPADSKPADSKAADTKATDTKTPDASKASDASKTAPAAAQPSTTGQGAGAAARLSTEQRSKITTVFRQQKVQPVTLGVSISIGTRVPSSVRYYPMPRDVIVIYPEWRGYDYILVGNQILVLDPRTHEIVAILDA